jgi:hypothetical protein
MSDNLEEKQQYLRSEIIEQGYNPNDFSDYMASIRGENALDLELWTFSDLQNVVSQYKAYVAQNQQNNEQQNEVQNQEEEQNNTNENNNGPQEGQKEDAESSVKNAPLETTEQKIVSDNGFPKEPFEEYEQIIKTAKLENNEITDQNDLYVTITNPTKINKGLFYPSYFQYTVQTSPVGFNVVRKVSDFTFLYEVLPLFNAGVFNPVLPHFEFGLKDDSPKKILYLKNYINSVVENKFYRTLPIIYDFLTLKQEEWDKKRLEKYSKLKPLPLSKMPTLEGELHIKINKSDDDRGFKIKDEITKRQEAYDELNTAMDELLATIEKLSLCYKSVANSLNNLNKTHKDNNATLSELFSRLLNLSKIWAKDCMKQRNFLRDEFKYYFKFMNKENVSFLKKYEEYKIARDDYKSKYEKVKKQPIKLPKDIDIVKSLRVDYGLQLIMVNSEYQNLLERQAYRSYNQFLKYNANKDIILQDYNNCIKLFNVNEDPNNLNEEGPPKPPEQQEQEQGEVVNQNQDNNTPEENNQE